MPITHTWPTRLQTRLIRPSEVPIGVVVDANLRKIGKVIGCDF